MPYDERWLVDVLARGQVRLVGGHAPAEPPALSERAFQQAVLRMAKGCGWYAYFTKDSRRSPSGYPDLTLVHPERRIALWVELKVPGGVLTLQQQHWLAVLGQVEHTEAYLWTPQEWEEICQTLRG